MFSTQYFNFHQLQPRLFHYAALLLKYFKVTIMVLLHHYHPHPKVCVRSQGGHASPRFFPRSQIHYRVPSNQVWMGYPQPGLGTPPGPVRMGYLPPPGQDRAPPPPTRNGVPTRTEQSEYLLHGGRYASCGNAGALSSYQK